MAGAPFKAAGMSFTAIDEIFDHLGPIPRLSFGNTRSLIDYRRKLDEALGRLTLGGLEDMSFSHESQALDAISHNIYMLKRSNLDVDSVEVDMMTITPFIASKVAARMRALECYELVRLFNRYIRLPSTRGMAGDVFEAYCHITFSTRIKFEFVPMVRIGGHTNDRGAKEPQCAGFACLLREEWQVMFLSHIATSPFQQGSSSSSSRWCALAVI